MDGNKICLTKKGYELIQEDGTQIREKPEIIKQRSASLPCLKRSVVSSLNQTYGKKQSNNNELSKLSSTLTKLKSIGVKKLSIKKEESQLAKILKPEMKKKQYLENLIPTLIKRTRDGKVGNLNSKYNRTVAYTERLIRTYESQKKYGMLYNKRQADDN